MAVFKKHDVAADMHGITEGVIWKQMLLFFLLGLLSFLFIGWFFFVFDHVMAASLMLLIGTCSEKPSSSLRLVTISSR